MSSKKIYKHKVLKTPCALPVVVIEPAFPDENHSDIQKKTSLRLSRKKTKIRGILHKCLCDPRAKEVSSVRPAENLLEETPSTYVMVSKEDPFPPVRQAGKSIKKSVSFNENVSEVGYKGYKNLYSTIERNNNEWKKHKKEQKLKSEFCKAHGFVMIEHYDKESGLYMQRWYDPVYGAGEGYKLKTAYKLINNRKIWFQRHLLRKGGFVMQSIPVSHKVVEYYHNNEIEEVCKELWSDKKGYYFTFEQALDEIKNRARARRRRFSRN